MNLWFRLLGLLIGHALFPKPKTGPLDDTRIQCRVWPSDLDISVHMTNSRYFALMDLARINFMIRVGLWKLAKERGWYPVLAASKMRFRRELRPFQRFRVTCRMICWDQRSVFMEQRFVGTDGSTHAVALMRAMVRSRHEGVIETPELIAALGVGELSSPPMPEHVRAWAAAEDALKEVTAHENREAA